MTVYLIHFLPAYRHAKHYLGFAADVEPRFYAHLHGKGARLTQVAKDAGVNLLLVRVWDGDRQLERKLKRRSHVPLLCPICCGQPVQMPLLGWMPAYVPEADQDNIDDSHDDLPPTGPDLFDYDAEAEDYEEDALDREFWRSGNW